MNYRKKRQTSFAENYERFERNRERSLLKKEQQAEFHREAEEENIDTRAYKMASVDRRLDMRELRNNRKLTEFF